MARRPDELRSGAPEGVEVVRGDVLDAASLPAALEGVDTAYFLIHAMATPRDFAREECEGARSFAQAALAAGVRRIVYLGGTPKAEIGPIRQSTDLTEMLQMDLEVEEKAVEIYTRAHKACTHDPTRYMLENHIMDEDKDVEEIRKYLGKVKIAEGQRGTERRAAGQ